MLEGKSKTNARECKVRRWKVYADLELVLHASGIWFKSVENMLESHPLYGH